jgi:hypothetical protein
MDSAATRRTFSQESRALQAPVDPGFEAGAFGYRRNPGVLLARIS